MSPYLVVATALLLGARHALEPDHLAAVSILAADEQRVWPAARLGMIWGLGHMLTMALVGIPVLLLRIRVPSMLGSGVDLAVGALLIVLGLMSLLRLRREQGHVHVHAHGGHVHTHFHTHRHDTGHAHAHAEPHRRRPALAFLIGCAHGLGGSGAVVILALAAAPSVGVGVAYLLVFGAGAVLGMFGLTLAVATPALMSAGRVVPLYRTTRAFAGVASACVGTWIWATILPGLLARR
ncbi:MAG TPA: hypothetical protein VFW01_06950 [bacterium]|nr:hypothetical protein [bacterium]